MTGTEETWPRFKYRVTVKRVTEFKVELYECDEWSAKHYALKLYDKYKGNEKTFFGKRVRMVVKKESTYHEVGEVKIKV